MQQGLSGVNGVVLESVKAQAYAKVVIEYNESRCKSSTLPLAARFAEINQDNQPLGDAWSIISDLFLEDEQCLSHHQDRKGSCDGGERILGEDICKIHG